MSATPKKPGRKRIEGKRVTFAISIRPELLAQVRARAVLAGQSVARFICERLEKSE